MELSIRDKKRRVVQASHLSLSLSLSSLFFLLVFFGFIAFYYVLNFLLWTPKRIVCNYYGCLTETRSWDCGVLRLNLPLLESAMKWTLVYNFLLRPSRADRHFTIDMLRVSPFFLAYNCLTCSKPNCGHRSGVLSRNGSKNLDSDKQ
jgi:hypothetical protein